MDYDGAEGELRLRRPGLMWLLPTRVWRSLASLASQFPVSTEVAAQPCSVRHSSARPVTPCTTIRCRQSWPPADRKAVSRYRREGPRGSMRCDLHSGRGRLSWGQSSAGADNQGADDRIRPPVKMTVAIPSEQDSAPAGANAGRQLGPGPDPEPQSRRGTRTPDPSLRVSCLQAIRAFPGAFEVLRVPLSSPQNCRVRDTFGDMSKVTNPHPPPDLRINTIQPHRPHRPPTHKNAFVSGHHTGRGVPVRGEAASVG